MDFYKTKMGRTFFEYQFPELISVLKKIACLKEEELSFLKQGLGATEQKSDNISDEQTKTSEPSYIYLCYEDSAALYANSGNINRVYITDDPARAKQWISLSRYIAKNSDYYELSENEVNSFLERFECGKPASLWVYKNGVEDSGLYYGICCRRFDLKEDEILLSLFCAKE